MESPVRKMLKKNDYARHKLLRKIKRQRKAKVELDSKAAEKELKRKLKVKLPKFDNGKDQYNFDPSAFDANGNLKANLEITTPEVVVTGHKPQYRTVDKITHEDLEDAALNLFGLGWKPTGTTNEIDPATGRPTGAGALVSVYPEFDIIFGRGINNLNSKNIDHVVNEPGIIKPMSFNTRNNVLGFDPTKLGYTGNFWKNTKVGQTLANSKLFKVPTFEEMGLSDAINSAKIAQYKTNVNQSGYTILNVTDPTKIQKVQPGYYGNALGSADLITNTINLTVPDALPFWRRNRYTQLLRGIARHEGAHLTLPKAYHDLTDFGILPVSTYDFNNDYYIVNPNSISVDKLKMLSDRNSWSWVKSPDEVMSELANLGELGLLHPNGNPTKKGLEFLADRFQLSKTDMTKVLNELDKYHDNFYTGNKPYNILDLILNYIAKEDVGMMIGSSVGIGTTGAGLGLGIGAAKFGEKIRKSKKSKK